MMPATSSEPSSRTCIVTMHGVGYKGGGSTLLGLAEHYTRETGALYRAAPVLIDGVAHTCYEPDRADAPTLLEVQWSDIRIPQTSWRSLLWQLARVLVAMLELATEWPAAHGIGRRVIGFYRAVLEFGVWAIPYIVYVMLLTALAPGAKALLIAPVVGGLAVLAWQSRHWSPILAVSGVVWTVVYAGVGIVALWYPAQWPSIIESASSSYVWRQQAFPFVIIALFVFCLTRSGGMTVEQRLTRFLFAYLPFMAIAIAGACLWVIAIPPVLQSDGYREWSRIHNEVLQRHHYDLRLAEYVHLAAITTFGIGMLVVALIYAIRRRTHAAASTGQFCRDCIPALTVLIPLGNVAVAGAVLFARTGSVVETADVLRIYEVSATRLLPFLPWLFGPMRIVFDVVGDVVLSALPNDHPMGIAARVEARLTRVLDQLTHIGCGRVVLMSHSLGAFFAGRVHAHMANARTMLVTTGSPQTALHRRFLGLSRPAPRHKSSAMTQWRNLYRGDDYVGGLVDELPADANIELRPGSGHTGYWQDRDVLAEVSSLSHDSADRKAGA